MRIDHGYVARRCVDETVPCSTVAACIGCVLIELPPTTKKAYGYEVSWEPHQEAIPKSGTFADTGRFVQDVVPKLQRYVSTLPRPVL